MALTLDTTIGGASSDSYVTLTQAKAFFAKKLNVEEWTKADDDTRARALAMAADRLQQEIWRGSRVTTTQRLAWPRYGVEKPDSRNLCASDWYDTDEIPAPVKDAQCWLALAYLKDPELDDVADEASVSSFAADGVNVTFGNQGRTARQQGDLPANAQRLLSGLLQGNKLQRG